MRLSWKATGSDAGKQDSDIEEDSAAEEGFMDYMISSSDLANTAGELEIQIPSRPSSSRGIRLKNGEAEMELIPKGGNFRKSVVEGMPSVSMRCMKMSIISIRLSAIR